MDGGKPNGTSLPPPEREKVQRLVLTDEMLTEVHGKIAHWDIYHAAVREVKKLCEVLEANSFLAVQDVVMGGPVGKGVVTKDTLQATVALFVKQLPFLTTTSGCRTSW